MIDVTRGLLGLYDTRIESVDSGVNVIIADFPLRWTVASMGHLFDKGINAVIPSQRAIPARLLEPKIKNRSRIHYLMANIEVSQFAGSDNWALLLDEDGFIAEGTGDNFFIVKNGAIITPEGRNILRGISREYIFELAQQHGLECFETNIEPYDVPVTKLNGRDIGDGKPGNITTFLLDKWSENVGVNIVSQIKSYADEVKIESPSPYEFKRK